MALVVFHRPLNECREGRRTKNVNQQCIYIQIRFQFTKPFFSFQFIRARFWVRWFIQFSALTVRFFVCVFVALGSKENLLCLQCMHIHQQNIHSFKFSLLFFIYLKFYTLCETGYSSLNLYRCEQKFRLNSLFKVNEGDFLTTFKSFALRTKKSRNHNEILRNKE